MNILRVLNTCLLVGILVTLMLISKRLNRTFNVRASEVDGLEVHFNRPVAVEMAH